VARVGVYITSGRPVMVGRRGTALMLLLLF
jgi:hypothetical protein